jgi:hypothetical protein
MCQRCHLHRLVEGSSTGNRPLSLSHIHWSLSSLTALFLLHLLRFCFSLIQIKMKSTATQYEELAQQIESILQNPEAPDVHIPDEHIRRRLADGGRKLSILLEEPRHTMSRLEHVVLKIPAPRNQSFRRGSNLKSALSAPTGYHWRRYGTICRPSSRISILHQQ